MSKIILRTAGVHLPGRKREVDLDHVRSIIDYVMRGYSVHARDDSPWDYGFIRFVDNAFVNQPEGTNEVMRAELTYWNDNAALVDIDPPEWVKKLEHLLIVAKPPTLHISFNVRHTDTPTIKEQA